MMRARGKVFFEPGKEEPGGVGGVEVIQGGEVGGHEMEGGQYAPEGRFLKIIPVLIMGM